MRHYPAYCTDCKRLWLVATQSAPSASPTCPRCGDPGRLVPGAYYSDAASLVFVQLEEAVQAADMRLSALGQLAGELERALPSPDESEIDQTFVKVMQQLGVQAEPKSSIGKRVALRMLVTISSTLSQPVVRESGVMRLPQTIPGLFDLVPKKRATATELQKAAPPLALAKRDDDAE